MDKSKPYDIGIVAAAHGVSETHRRVFLDAIKDGNPECSYIVDLVDDSPQPYPMFSKPLAINHGLRRLLPQCRVVVQTDADMMIPPGAIDITYKKHCEDDNKIVWIVGHECRDFHGAFEWDRWKADEQEQYYLRQNASGSWISLTAENWELVGGFCEDLWGWASDDLEIAARITFRGIKLEKIIDIPLMHQFHKDRPYKLMKYTSRNNNICATSAFSRNWLKKKLPDFLIMGGNKCGSEAAWENLRQHPDIFMAEARRWPISEVRFFDDKWDRGEDWYGQFFYSKAKLSGEKTSQYLHKTYCHERIKQTLPNAKLIVLLRDPVTRAYSQMNHARSVQGWNEFSQWNHLSVRDAFDEAIKNKHWDKTVFSYGHYVDQLENLYQHFPREQVHVAIAERTLANRSFEYNKMFSFLGVPEMEFSFKRVHFRYYENPMSEEASETLRDYYKESNERLFDLLGYRVEEWL